MSRRKELANKFNGSNDNWITSIFVANLPMPMLANDYIRGLASIANAILLTEITEAQRKVRILDITDNI